MSISGIVRLWGDQARQARSEGGVSGLLLWSFRKLGRGARYGLKVVGAIGDPRNAPNSRDELNLVGDRDVEWSWTAAHIREPAGRVLDLGPSDAATPLIASFVATEVIALDITPQPVPYRQPNITYRKGDILRDGLPNTKFDTIINCSTTEHIGLSGRYGSAEEPDGDLRAMALLRDALSGPESRMILTIPVGRDNVERPYHRIYGPQRLPKLLAGYKILKEAYFAKPSLPNVWVPVTREIALNIKGSSSFYSLGCFVLCRE